MVRCGMLWYVVVCCGMLQYVAVPFHDSLASATSLSLGALFSAIHLYLLLALFPNSGCAPFSSYQHCIILHFLSLRGSTSFCAVSAFNISSIDDSHLFRLV